MGHKYKVIIAPRAGRMLEWHLAFLARVSDSAARRLRQDFAQVIDRIADNPFLFPEEQDESGYRGALFAKRYKAIFCIEGKTAYIDAVLDCRMDNE